MMEQKFLQQLLAPAAGGETRDSLKKKLSDAKDQFGNIVGQVKETAQEFQRQGKETFEEAKRNSQNAKV